MYTQYSICSSISDTMTSQRMHCMHHSLSFTRAVCLPLAPLLGQVSSVYLSFIQSLCAFFYIMCFSPFSCMWCIAHMTLHPQYHPPNPHLHSLSSMKFAWDNSRKQLRSQRWTCLKYCFDFVGLCHIFKWRKVLSTKIFWQQKSSKCSLCVFKVSLIFL